MAKLSLPAYDRTTLPNVLAALLLVAIMALMFLPYFDYGTEAAPSTASIHQYLWFPNAAPKLTAWLKNTVASKTAVKVNVVVVEPLLMILAGVLGIMTFGFSRFWRVGLLCNLFLAMSIATVLAGIASVVVLTLDK